MILCHQVLFIHKKTCLKGLRFNLGRSLHEERKLNNTKTYEPEYDRIMFTLKEIHYNLQEKIFGIRKIQCVQTKYRIHILHEQTL